MNIAQVVLAELRYRKLNVLLAVLTIVIAVAACVYVLTALSALQRKTEQRVAAMDNEIRKITKNMGFNITILPNEQNLADFHAQDFAEKTMPWEYVTRLSDSPEVVTIQHLRPALIRKIQWPEKNRQVLLMGVSAVVPFAHRAPKKPLSQPVAPGTINLGSVLASQLDIKVGDQVLFHGKDFKVEKVFPQRGSKDDITIWVSLSEAQKILGLEGRINMIQALECNCASVDRLAEIQVEISGLLGDKVQVIELATKAIARAKAREGVKAEGQAAIARLQQLASMLLPLVILAAGLLVGLLTLSNVRDRRTEIGVFRAVGTRTGQILALFIVKALIVGTVGALLGYSIGYCVAAALHQRLAQPVGGDGESLIQFNLTHLLTVVLLTPALAMLASWLPALTAASQDPTVVLREE